MGAAHTLGSKCGVNTSSGRGSTPVGDRLSSLDTSSGSSLGLGLLLLLLLDLLRVTVEEHIHHNAPAIGGTGNGAPQPKDLSGKQPPKKTNRVATLVVCGDGDVDELQGCVSVGEGNDGDVDIGSLANGLVVHAGIRDNDQTGLLERASDVVGEATGGETTCDGLGTGVGSVFEDGTVAVRAGRDDDHVAGVLDGSNNSGSEHKLLPGLAEVDDVHTYEAKYVGISIVTLTWFAGDAEGDVPSALLFQTYGSICLSTFLVPMCD